MTKENGQGISLSISRMLLSAYGGKIVTNNRKGGGTEVQINIPLINIKVK